MSSQLTKTALALSFIFYSAGLYSQAIDTTGLNSYRPLYNSMKTWDEGAFNMNQKGHPDYGWGVYNAITHNLGGTTTYLLKQPSGSVKRVFINSKNSISNVYSLTYANLDGSNSKTRSVRTTDFAINPKRLFVYYSLANDTIVDREPAYSSWDFVLTRYHENLINYNVTGFLINENVKAAVYKAPDSARAVNSTLADTTRLSDSLTIIGNSWYRLVGMNITPVKTNVYFVKTDPDTIYKMIVNYFQSGMGGQARVGIQTQLMRPSQGQWVYDTLTMGANYANDVYYHLRNKTIKTVPRNNWDIAFKTNQMSASILANTTTGNMLYTYPNWYPVPVEEISLVPTMVYPNPSHGIIHIVNDEWLSDSEISIRVFNMNGQYIISDKRSLSGTELILDLSRFSTGFYQFRIESGGKIYSGRILISR